MEKTLYTAATLQDRRDLNGKLLYSWVASTSRPDINGNVMQSSGWDLAHFRQFPNVLLNHKMDELPIARAHRTEVVGDQLQTDIWFLDTPTAREVQQLVDAEIITGMSIGARPLEWDLITGPRGEFLGIRSKRQVLVEESIVSIPANPDAVRLATLHAYAAESILNPILRELSAIKELPW